MKFSLEMPCTCGQSTISFSTYGDDDWSAALCSECGRPAHLTDPLSVSVTAERLLHRSKAELDSGDYSLSILIATMAVESFLTRLFFKLKGMDNYVKTFSLPTREQEQEWESEYPRTGGFLRPAEFVSKAMVKAPFDEFVAKNKIAARIMAGFPDAANLSAKQYFQSELFCRRNRITHWGYVNSTRQEAQLCHALAVAIVSLLREMDEAKYGSLA